MVRGLGQSQLGPNASNEKCTTGRVLFRIQYRYNNKNT